MSFDWGGFSGTFVGTFGAYLVARISHQWAVKSKEPELIRRRLEMVQEIDKVVRDATNEIAFIDSLNGLSGTNHRVYEVLIDPLSKIGIQSIDVHDGLFTFVLELKEEIFAVTRIILCFQCSPRGSSIVSCPDRPQQRRPDDSCPAFLPYIIRYLKLSRGVCHIVLYYNSHIA